MSGVEAPIDYRFEHRPTWHPSAKVYAQTSIAPSARIGERTVVWRYTTILENVIIGDDCVIGACVFLGADVTIGDATRLHHGAALAAGSRVGARVYIGTHVTFIDVKYTDLGQKDAEIHRPPVVEDDVMIGCNSVLLPGVVVGRGACVGAGSVVTKDVPAGVTVMGNPARRQMKSAPRQR